MNEHIWQAIVACDPAYDGRVYYGLLTTGIFCKPSCKSKTPNKQNVRIYSSPEEAQRDGLRPCKRCRPDKPIHHSPDVELVEQLTRLIHERYHDSLTLSEMAAHLYISPFYLQKCFTRIMNMSPANYLKAIRVQAAKAMLAETKMSMTSIAHAVGFQNSAYFSSVFQKATGYAPTAYRAMMLEENGGNPRLIRTSDQ